MVPEVFVDSGAWIALSIDHDAHHGAAISEYHRLVDHPVLLVTTNLVIGESYALIHRFGGHQRAVRFLAIVRRSPSLNKVYSDAALEDEAEALLVKYADQDFSFVDAVSFVVMHSRGIAEAFAFDHHFQTAGYTLVPNLR